MITRAGYRRLAVRLIYLAVICYLLFTYCFLITQCHGQDMFPAMKDGDLCVVFRVQTQKLFGEKIVADDIIAYQTDGKRAFGRVVAVAGDVVMIGDSGSPVSTGRIDHARVLTAKIPLAADMAVNHLPKNPGGRH